MRIALRLLTVTIVALSACGGAASVVVDPTAAPTTAAPTTAAPTSTPATALSWTVSDKSKATARVHEQLVGVNLPSDAVLVATGAKGSFSLNADGTFASGSKVTFDLTTLSSDNRDRDNFAKQDTLSTRAGEGKPRAPTSTSLSA